MKKYYLTDWLKAHFVDRNHIEGLLSLSRSIQCDVHDLKKGHFVADISAHDAWKLASNALSRKFPNVSKIIRNIETNCTINFSADKNSQPYTLDQGEDGFPHVSLYYQGNAADIINIAHEFSHAVQIYAREGKFIPPILREVSAFLGELILIGYLGRIDHKIQSQVRSAWSNDHSIYLGKDADELNRILTTPDTPYFYRWNYPVARIIAYYLFPILNMKELWEVFLGHWPLVKCIEVIQNSEKIQNIRNYLPEIPAKSTDTPVLKAYRSLGMILCLDVNHWKGRPKETIENYYSILLEHLKTQSVYIAIGNLRKPIGYVTWKKDVNDPKIVRVMKQSAPFGDHLMLLRKWKEYLPEDLSVMSTRTQAAPEREGSRSYGKT